MPRLLYISAGAALILVIILILALVGVGRKEAEPEPVALELWGLEDDGSVWANVIERFRKEYPHISVSYRRFPADSYEETLVNRLAEGKGPDLFLLPNAWLVKHRDKIAPLARASNPFSAVEMSRTFVDDPAKILLGEDGGLLGLPLFVDSLALFYNKDIFEAAGIAEAPRTWDETADLSRRLTKTAPNGDLIRSGLALGLGKNVSHAMEIVSALILQQGDEIVRADGRSTALGGRAEEALRLWASFADPSHRNFSWTSSMPNSLDAFAQGKAAMAIGFSRDMPRIRAKNPHINMGAAPLPQISTTGASRTYASYWFPVVSRLSKNQGAAWQFIFWTAYPQGAGIYGEASGRPPARRDLIAEGAKKEIDEVFFRQALIARGWPIPDEQATRRIFAEALDSLASRAISPEQAVGRISAQLQLYTR